VGDTDRCGSAGASGAGGGAGSGGADAGGADAGCTPKSTNAAQADRSLLDHVPHEEKYKHTKSNEVTQQRVALDARDLHADRRRGGSDGEWQSATCDMRDVSSDHAIV
jgi:hypothetical protein